MLLASIANAAKKPSKRFLTALMAAHSMAPDLEEHSTTSAFYEKEVGSLKDGEAYPLPMMASMSVPMMGITTVELGVLLALILLIMTADQSDSKKETK